ncbi:MAG TPA: SGNH/GDSL hydrolase family protein [Beutenbergiaceae bacterium]|nr:SGNH/GDSL hydrolase family protein [Beutenbergiaceae bacterium]
MADVANLCNLLTHHSPLTWVLTGDSITHGARHTNGQRSYPELLIEVVRGELRRFRDAFINTAVSGDRISDINSDFTHRVARWQPDIVTLMIGTNDCAANDDFPRVEVDEFANQVDDFVLKSHEVSAVVVLQTPPPVDTANAPERERIAEFAHAIRSIARARKTFLVDHHDAFIRMGGHMFPWALLDDPFHPGALGHAAIAVELARELGIKETPVVSRLRHQLGARGLSCPPLT